MSPNQTSNTLHSFNYPWNFCNFKCWSSDLTWEMKMLPKIFNRCHYLNKEHNESAESNIFSSSSSRRHIREVFLDAARKRESILTREESKVETHERMCTSFDFQINEMYQICSPVLFISPSGARALQLSRKALLRNIICWDPCSLPFPFKNIMVNTWICYQFVVG